MFWLCERRCNHHESKGSIMCAPVKHCTLPCNPQVGSVDDNSSGGGYAYRASKSALNIINKSMSIDLKKDNITSVLLHPGTWPHSACTRYACVRVFVFGGGATCVLLPCVQSHDDWHH